uniref:Membrane fusion protein biotin-lipoyl like domain-containing protein n=1 Tax=Synechococcus lacustris str. Tous TaxID=1910958 RepID=A0A2P7ECT8_9SYNE
MALPKFGKLAKTKKGDLGSPANRGSVGDRSDTRLESRPTPWFPLITGGAMAVLVLVCLAAAAFVRVDQVVSLSGKLQPKRSTEAIRSTEAGVVTNVLVKEGQAVEEGQALVLLDPTILEGRQLALKDQKRELLLMAGSEISRLRGAVGELKAQRIGLEESRRILKLQLDQLLILESQGAASRFQVLDYQKQLSDVDSRLLANSQQQNKLEAESSQKSAELRQQEAQNTANRVETGERLRRITLRAPANGTVLNLKAKGGMVINASQDLLQLVPNDSLVGNVFVSNRDLAFVRPGQQGEVAVDAYDRNKYGTLAATVTTIGTDSLPPNENWKEPYFPISLKLAQQNINSLGKTFPLQAGMAITADLKLEKRSLLELFFSNIAGSTLSVREMR